MSKNEKKSPLLLNEIAMLGLFHLRALAKSSLGALLIYLRNTDGEFSDWLEANKETLLSEVPEFSEYWDKLKNSL